jgi:beta-lactamase regulating signal transducer with metallopeptidase domain
MMTLDRAWDSLVTITLQSGLLCLMAAAGLLLLRKAAAASRHLLLLMMMSALLTVPLLSLFLPHWQVRWPRSAPEPPHQFVRPVLPLVQIPEHYGRVGVRGRQQQRSALAPVTAVGPVSSVVPPEPLSAGGEPTPSSAAVASAAEVRPARTPLGQTSVCKKALLAVWLLGCVVALLRLLAGLLGTRRVTAREAVADPALSRMVMQVQTELGFGRPVEVRHSVAEIRLPVPLTWGLLRPTLLLPPTFLEWPPERRRMVLLHELAHIQRADWLVQVLVQITRALYWFHPLVWWTTRRLQEESERACDDTVLLTGVAPSAYAETLLEVLRTMNRPKTSAFSLPSMLSMARPPIEARLRAILSPQRRQKPPRTVTLLGCAATAVCALALASVQVGAGPAPISHTVSSLFASMNAASAHAGVPSPPQTTAHLRLASTQTSAEKQRTLLRKLGDKDDAAGLRQRLDAMEKRLAQNQQENARLRQQLKTLTAQQRSRVMSRALEAAPSEAELSALNTVLRDMKQQQALLQTQANLSEDLYRNGAATREESFQQQAEMEALKLSVDAIKQQIDALKAGHRPSAKEQRRNQLLLRQAALKAHLRAAQDKLSLTKERHKAGTVSSSELTAAEQEVARLQVEIDELMLELSRPGASARPFDPFNGYLGIAY